MNFFNEFVDAKIAVTLLQTIITFQPVEVDQWNLVVLKNKVQSLFSEILNFIGLLGAKFVFFILMKTSIVYELFILISIFKMCFSISFRQYLNGISAIHD